MPLVVPLTRKLHPKLDLFLTENRTRDLLQALATGQVEAALLALPVAQAGLVAHPILVEPFYLAVPAGHGLASKTALTMEALSGQTLYLPEDGPCLKDQALEVCRQTGAH